MKRGDRKLLERKIARAKASVARLASRVSKICEKYLKYFNAFVISSLTEGLPISLLEASAWLGSTIVYQPSRQTRDTRKFGEAGILVDPGKISELRDAITETRKNEGQFRIGQKKLHQSSGEKYSSLRWPNVI